MESAFTEMFAGVNIYTLIALALWSLPWKAWAMWLSARRGDFWWFLAFLLVSTIGILEIVYIFFIAKESDKRPETPPNGDDAHKSSPHDTDKEM